MQYLLIMYSTALTCAEDTVWSYTGAELDHYTPADKCRMSCAGLAQFTVQFTLWRTCLLSTIEASNTAVIQEKLLQIGASCAVRSPARFRPAPSLQGTSRRAYGINHVHIAP
ncbi:hypothetical protein GDO78_006039 [Eleutherodactylus coqui]|uniref:Secreted protein n=1 Tax=Eleutherodactylus coqui TaxID=57060 RepID=A0A8J6FNA5_ELECQ|nr:hypothetical protein GDO78_006039 [Eleutherodactylus coqui]